MLLIIVLGLIVKLALVSGDCVIGTTPLTDFDWSRFSGPRPWYASLHKSQDLENTFDCPIGIAASPEGSRSSINATVYDKNEKLHRTLSGYATNWNSTGYFEIHNVVSLWNGYLYCIGIDYDRYAVFKHCREETDELSYYVGYRSISPDEATVTEVNRVLQDNNIDRSQLVKWSTDNCPQAES